jgi:outer membrane protein, multidrug efflux system
LLAFEGQVLQARAGLAAALQIEDDLVLTDEPSNLTQPLPSLERALAEAVRRRPEVAAAQARVSAQDQNIRALTGAYWPQLSVVGQVSGSNQALGVPRNTLTRDFVIGINASWLIFDSLHTRTSVREARLQRDRAGHAHTRVGFVVDAEVRAAHARWQKAVEQRRLIAAALALVGSTVELVTRRYTSGTALVIEVLSAEDELLSLESDLINNALDIMQAQVAFRTTLGAR